MSPTVYSQVLIYTAESTEASWRERKCPNFETAATGEFEPGLSRLRVRHSTTELPRSTWKVTEHHQVVLNPERKKTMELWRNDTHKHGLTARGGPSPVLPPGRWHYCRPYRDLADYGVTAAVDCVSLVSSRASTARHSGLNVRPLALPSCADSDVSVHLYEQEIEFENYAFLFWTAQW